MQVLSSFRRWRCIPAASSAPPVALSSTGRPTFLAYCSASSPLDSSGLPASTGTSASSARARAVCF